MNKNHSFLPHIEGMRALAVISVIINHLNDSWLPGGYLGVDIFFVISGFVITRSLLGYNSTSIGTNFLNFYTKRFKRLVPALITVLLVTMLLIRLVDPSPMITSLTAITSVFGLSNIFLYFTGVDYFGDSITLNPLMHTWSLGVEEQFYMIFPLLFFVFHKNSDNSYKRLFYAIAIICVASFFSFALLIKSNLALVYYLAPFRAWELGIGCLLALSSYNFSKNLSSILQWLSFVFLIIAFIIGDKDPLISATLAAVGSAGFVASGSKESFLNHVMSSRPMKYIGRLSYSIYLWHWPLICLAIWTVGLNYLSIPLILAMTFGLSMLSFHLIEKPLRFGSLFNLKIALIVMLVAAGAVFIMYRYNIPEFSGSSDAEIARTGYTPNDENVLESNRLINDCMGRKVYKNQENAGQIIESCGAIVPNTTRFVFFGDSHSLDMFGVAEVLYKEKAASVYNFGQPGCRAPQLDTEPTYCNYIETVLKELSPLEMSQKGFIVLRSNYNPKTIDGSLSDYTSKIEDYVKNVKTIGYGVIYVAPAPKFPLLVPGGLCTEQWYRPKWALSEKCQGGFLASRTEQLDRRKDFYIELKKLETSLEGFYVFDPFDILCGSDTENCSASRNGVPIYRDESHLTFEGGKLLGQEFLNFLIDKKLVHF